MNNSSYCCSHEIVSYQYNREHPIQPTSTMQVMLQIHCGNISEAKHLKEEEHKKSRCPTTSPKARYKLSESSSGTEELLDIVHQGVTMTEMIWCSLWEVVQRSLLNPLFRRLLLLIHLEVVPNKHHSMSVLLSPDALRTVHPATLLVSLMDVEQCDMETSLTGQTH